MPNLIESKIINSNQMFNQKSGIITQKIWTAPLHRADRGGDEGVRGGGEAAALWQQRHASRLIIK